MKSVPGAKTLRTADIEDVGFDFEKRLCETGSLEIGCGQEVGAIMGLVTSVSLCYREGRLEPGYSCDWEEAWSLGQHRERSGPREGRRAAWMVSAGTECRPVLVLSLCVMHSDVLV